MKKSVFFKLGLSCLLTHELDAMTHKEWQLLLPFLEDSQGRLVFVIAHLPLFYLIFHFLAVTDQVVKTRFEKILCFFMIAHCLAHFTFSHVHPQYTFVPPLETITVYGAAFCSLLYFWMSIKESRKNVNF